MSEVNRHRDMLFLVAEALGPDLRKQIAFTGGCTTGLFITDDFSRDQIRHTNDVDLIVGIVGAASYSKLQAELRSIGFSNSLDADDPICAMKLGALRVDFMPDDEQILGFSNRWYRDALTTADDYLLARGVSIKLIKPIYFVATKLEAYLGRGNNDPMESHDIEDFLNIFNGRAEILKEVAQANKNLRTYIAERISALFEDDNFGYAVQSCAFGDVDREALIFERLHQVAVV